MPELRKMRAVLQFLRQSAEPCAAPPTSPFMALLMDPRAVKAQARFPRCSSGCVCTLLAVLRSGPLLQLRVPVGTFRDFGKEQATTESTEYRPGLVTARASFQAFCPSRSVSRHHASRKCHR